MLRQVMNLYALLIVVMLVCIVNSSPQAGRKRPETNQQLTPRSAGPRVIYLRGVKMELVPIPAGSFQMGAERYHDEKPMHEIMISKAFFLGRHEVTQAQWRALMGSNPSSFIGEDLPVEQVSWNDTQNFTQRLNQMNDGYSYRLPTEAEWEYACRAGSTGEYAGDLDSMAWNGFNSGMRTHRVGSKQPNAYGLYDMHGNVWEWCQDWYDGGYYANSPITDPQGPVRGQYRVLRGGSWVENANAQRSATRYKNTPDYRRNGFIGFRIVAIAGT